MRAQKDRRRLSPAQRRMITDDVEWVGWDAKNRPVIRITSYELALTRDGNTINVTYPVERAP